MFRTLKSKISLALVFFLIMISLISFLGYQYISRFANDSRAIMEDNFESVRYAAAMQKHFGDIHAFHIQNIFSEKLDKNAYFKPTQNYQRALIWFQTQLAAANRNITEKSEAELLMELKSTYKKYLEVFSETYNASTQNRRAEDNIRLVEKEFQPLQIKVESLINNLYDINIQAIGNKSRSIQEIGTTVLFYLGLLIILTILVNLALLIFLPGYLANPMIDLNTKIKAILEGQYEQKLEVKFHRNDEINELAHSFNQMAAKLSHFDDSNLSKIWREKRRAESLIYLMKEAVWVLDEHKIVLHLNQQAQSLLGMNEKDIIGKPIFSLANQYEFIKDAICDWMFEEGKSYQKENNHLIAIQHQGKVENYRKYTIDIINPHETKKTASILGYAIVLEKV